MENFGTRLREIRKLRNLTIGQLAERCNSSDKVIRSYEKSRRKPTSNMLLRLCEALKTHPNYLYQDELTFNPYEEKDELVTKLQNLPPNKYSFVESVVRLVEKI